MTADTFSTTLGTLLMGTGNDNNSWGNNCNNEVFQILEDAIANKLNSTVTGGTLDLSGSPPPNGPSQVRYAILIFGGVLASNQTVIVPQLEKLWLVVNSTSGAFTLSLKTPTGAAVPIPQNSGFQTVRCNGSNGFITVSPFNWQQIQMPDGSAAAPAFSNVNEPTSGWYRNGTQDWRLAIGGTDVLQVTGSGAGTPNVFNVLAPLSLQSAGAQVVPPGFEGFYAGISPPTGWLFSDGNNASRTTFANLFGALRQQFTCTFTNGSASLTGIPQDLRNFGIEGAVVECTAPGISNLTISQVFSNSITLSAPASASSGGTVTVFAYPYGNGDGSTTFTLPDRRDAAIFGRSNMGGTARGLVTTVPTNRLNGGGGAELWTLRQSDMPNITLAVAASGSGSGSGSFSATNSYAPGTISINQGVQGTGLTAGAQGGATFTAPQNNAITPTVSIPSYTPTGTVSVSVSVSVTGATASLNGGTAQTSINKLTPLTVSNVIIKT